MKVKRRIDKSLVIFIFLFIISSVLVLSNEGFKATKEGTLTIVSLFQSGFSRVIKFTSTTLNAVGELKDLKKKYDKLIVEVDEYRGIEREFLELKRENIELKSMLEFNSRIVHDSIPCEVIGKDPSNLSSVVTINKGKKHGITKNSPVVSEQNGLIGVVGKVISVGFTNSQVLPLLDETSYIASRFTETRYEGLIKGTNESGSLDLKYVEKIAYKDISIGDLVETSGMKSIYPRGYYIGRVSSIDKVEYNTSLEITIDPIIDFSRLEYLSVLVPGDNNE